MMKKVITKVLSVSEKTKQEMIEYFDEFKREKTPPYAVFQADDGDTVVTMYESGKVVFQGFDADLASSYWIETEKINSGQALVTNSQEKRKLKQIPLNISSIGSDEVGTGDFFGPIVVTATYVSKDNIDFLLKLGVKDSKKLSDHTILSIVPQIIKIIPYQTFILSNTKYNQLYSKEMNMNKIKAILHYKVLSTITRENKYSYDYIVIDQFESPKSFYYHTKESPTPLKNLTFITHAEDQVMSVACASLISRYIFLKEIDKISQSLKMPIPLGAGHDVDQAGLAIISQFGKNKLTEIAKLNFKNMQRIL